MNTNPQILATKPTKDYELLDSGDGEKLERFGAFVLRRPDPQALWQKSLSVERWDGADAQFVTSGRTGNWKKNKELPESWEIEIAGAKFVISLSAFKHTGIFPEQSENWNWIQETIKKADRKVSVLNLFGYTGGATLAAAKAGADVCHVDGSKVSVAKASDNAKASGLGEKPIRWIIDDALSFVKREVRRGNKYDAIIMDPPSYGHGAQGEVWKIEEGLRELLAGCQKLLSDTPVFVLINGYAAGYSAIAYKNNLLDLIGNKAAEIEFGELALETEGGRQLPAGIYARARLL
ncbi:MAG TPA: class I SAM-dependent methyltransferase [Candidatus Nanoarchaeia archaeon]|nr:class I SAM-dependent methyltransferase [Candidatus Nanoarchaeia archaeon]